MMSIGASSKQAQQRVIDRAMSDPEFRKRFLQSPSAAIQEQLGISLPSNVSIRVVEEQPGEVILVLPARAASGRHLSDADLEAVAGGEFTYGICSWIPGDGGC